MVRRTLQWLIPVMFCVAPSVVWAQSEPKLSTLVPNLVLGGITLPGGPAPTHAGHFSLLNPTFGGSQSESRVDREVIRSVAQFNDRFRSQLANFPLGSSSGGFTFTLDEKLGLATRRSNSFGPSFAERAETIGRGQFSAGFTFQYSGFDTFGGENLDDGSIRFYLRHSDCCGGTAPPPPSPLTPGFEGDLIEAALHLKVSTQTFAFFGNYGVTDKLDIGVALPISRVSLDASVHATILRLSTSAIPAIHTFEQGADVTEHEFTAPSASATGVGDITLRTKYNFMTTDIADLSFGLDLRLPTGDEEDLLGTGATSAKLFLIASSAGERLSPHLNVGFTVSGTGDTGLEFGDVERVGISDEFNYAVGVEFIANPRLTIVGDVIGRTLFDARQVEAEEVSFFFIRQGDATNTLQESTLHPITGQPYQQLTVRPGNLNLLLGSAGFKFSPLPNFLIGANVLFPLTSGGLRDYFTLSLGFDYAFK